MRVLFGVLLGAAAVIGFALSPSWRGMLETGPARPEVRTVDLRHAGPDGASEWDEAETREDRRLAPSSTAADESNAAAPEADTGAPAVPAVAKAPAQVELDTPRHEVGAAEMLEPTLQPSAAPGVEDPALAGERIRRMLSVYPRIRRPR